MSFNREAAAILLVSAGLYLRLVGYSAEVPLAWEQREGHRFARLTVPTTARTGFHLLNPDQTSILFTNEISYERSLTNTVLLEGGGVAAGDFDGDGLVDLYFCHVDGSNALFRNLGGLRFQNVTSESGGGCAQQNSRGAAFADLDGDGALDLIVSSRGGPNACFLNDGKGRFQDITQDSGLVLKDYGCSSLALADMDGNGSLDVYIVNNDLDTRPSRTSLDFRMVNGKPRITGRAARTHQIVDGLLIKLGAPGDCFRNDAKGRFTAVSWTDGTFLAEDGQPLKQAPHGLGLSAAFRDLNGDGAPDLYVCNDLQTPDRIWINDGKGQFRALPDFAIRTTCFSSMAVDFADIDRDGFDDIFTADMYGRSHTRRKTQLRMANPPSSQVGEDKDRHQAHRNTFQLNRGDGTYAEIANYAGLDATDWTWGAAFHDVDLDGYEDLLILNGHAYDLQDLDTMQKESSVRGASLSVAGPKVLKDYPPATTPNLLFRNRGDRSFEEIGTAWGFDSTNISHGIAFADLDNDGDLDVTVSCLGKPPLIYRNDTSAPRVAVRLKGRAPNTQGIGARITVRNGAVPEQHQEMQCGGRYLSSDQPIRTFATGFPTNELTIEVRWRSGLQSFIRQAQPNCLYEIDEAFAKTAPPVAKSEPANRVIFEDVSARLSHTHEDPPFNDLERQPLLHRFLSRSGPGVAWFDLDGDGRDELILGAGHDRKLAVFKTDGKGAFARWEIPAWNAPLPDDATGLVGWTPAPGQRALLAGISGYETDPTKVASVLRFDAASAPQAAFASAAEPLSTGPLASADYDGDGDLDVFVGGRVIPGRYPEATTSKLFRNDAGTLTLDRENSAALKQTGLVSGAVFSDLDGDGFVEMILACEWEPVRVFKNSGGKFHEATSELGLSNFTGWWNGVTTGDINGDGRLDIIASNWGLNSSYYRPSIEHPLLFYHGDFDDNGTIEILETEFDTESGQVGPRHDLSFLSEGWPLLRTRFATHRQFSTANVNAVMGEAAPKANKVQATTLASMLFLNRGDRFEAVLLPPEAQFAPAFAICVSDLDGDGNEDVFLSQNFFAVRQEEPRLDAGRGLWLRGDGTGKLAPVPGQVSGVKVYGEQRGAAVADFDEDGRVDLVVSQNSGATKLYHNVGANPGLLVRLQGPPGNPTAVGASVRLHFGQKAGPAREIHAGSGYWSQDSAVQVMARPQPANQIWVRWPGGRITTNTIPPGAKSIVVEPGGTLQIR